LSQAVSFYLSQLIEDQCNEHELALFIRESCDLLSQHLNESDLGNFPFAFASAIIRCRIFQETCLDRALPIFMDAVISPFLEIRKTAGRILTEGIIPYLKHLEDSEEALAKLREIAEIVKSPALSIVYATLEGKDFQESLSGPLTSEQLNLAMSLLTEMSKSAPMPLAESIFAVMTRLVTANGSQVHQASLIPMYTFALERVATFQSAINFVKAVSELDPSIAPNVETTPIEGTPEELRRHVSEKLLTNVPETVAMTNCKKFIELSGLIDQKNPPAIYPWAASYEIYSGLKRNSTVKQAEMSAGRLPGHASQVRIATTKSVILASAMQNVGRLNLTFEPIPVRPLSETLIELPTLGTAECDFILTLDEFTALGTDQE
jgi:hypothetical protein